MTKVGVILATAAALMMLASGPGTRWKVWNYKVGLALFAGGALIAGVAALISLLAWRQQHSHAPLVAAAACAVMVLVPVTQILALRGKPRIHDISTDLDDPPQFSAVLPLRGASSNPADKITDRVRRLQPPAYPDVKPLVLALPPDAAFARALAAARDLGWTVVSERPGEGVIEATDMTRFFGFQDDIVVRLRPDGAGTRVDVRSTSRVGIGDGGKNAERIRRFLSAL